MRRLWLGLWFAVVGWDALLPHIASPAPRLAAGALAVAAVLFCGAPPEPGWPNLPAFGRSFLLVLAAACAVTSRALPWPECAGPLLILAAALLAALPRVARAAGGRPARGLAVLGGTLLGLAALSHLYRVAESVMHDLDFLARPLAATYRLLGVHASADPPFVNWQGVGVLHSIDVSLEKLVGHGLALYTAAGLGLLAALHGGRLGWRRPAAWLGLAIGFAWVRYVVLGLVLDQLPSPSIFYARTWVLGSLLPFVALVATVLPPAARAVLQPTARAVPVASAPLSLRLLPASRRVAAVVSVFLVGALAAGWLGFHDPGAPKQGGRILVDERHSNWEWSTIQLDTLSYGVQTVYNYSELVRYLAHYYDIAANFHALDDSTLAGCDVLVLKTPTRPYEKAEVDAVVRFVERGGGVWLIGDHTNIFGMGTNLNMIARHFGIRFRYDAVIDLLTYGRQLYEHPRLFAHPVVRHVPPLLMATSCSLEGPLLGRRVMLGQSLLSDELDYSVNTFFGNFQADSREPFGTILQSVAVTRGRGRVLVFSDSTIFSNFFMFIRGKAELALGSIGWLMRTNRFGWVRGLLLVALLLAAAASVLFLRGMPREAVLGALLVAALPAFALAARGMDAWTASVSRPPPPRTPLPLIAFERGRTEYIVPDVAEAPERSPASFHTFYVWTQRVGYIPSTRLFEDCVENAEITVLVNPRAPFAPSEVAALQEFVRNGSALLVIDSPHARQFSTANTVLQAFGMSFETTEAESAIVRDAATGDSVCMMHHLGSVLGGQPVLLRPDGRAVLAEAKVGEGRVVALCASDNFSDAVLGTTSEVPTPEQLALYRIEFRIFDQLLRTEPRRAAGAPPPEPPRR